MGIFGQTTEAMMEVYTQPYNLMKKTKLPFRLVRTMVRQVNLRDNRAVLCSTSTQT
jgi:hypothetical protein